ncbi:hypothetical protein BD769DRAFT_1428826 [Suillus cothurnatus]|nr:hypothetical protein BD769DRAFT_1428826 [Suillus cothurnatus]
MNTLFTRASLKRSSRTRTRKNSISDAGCPPPSCSHSSILQIIPECSENDFDSSPRVTLSAFTFSIDDALLMLNDAPRSPALSASSSTDDGHFEMPSTPGTSDDEDFADLPLPTPRLRPKRVSIRPLCITKTRSIVEDVPEITDAHEEEDEYDFYTRQFEDFISLYSPVTSSLISAPPPARPDSIIISPEVAPQLPVEAFKPRGRSRFSKALPLLPLPTPPPTTIPPVPPLPVSAIRRKRVLPPLPMYPPPPPPIESRPPPRMTVPSDIEDDILFEEVEQEPTRPIVIEQVWFDDEEDSIYSQPSFVPAQNIHPISPAAPKTPMNEVYLPCASTDSDTPRSSLDSFSSSHSHSSFSSSSSFEERSPISPFSFPPTPKSESHQLRSRWSCSTISSLAAEPPRTILSPLREVFISKSKLKSGSGSRRAPLLLPIMSSPPRSRTSPSSSPLQTRTNTQNQTRAQSPYKMPLTRMVFPATPSPPTTPTPRHIRRQDSRSSTSSGSSESGSCESGGSPGLRRKPIPVEMFLRA